MSTLLSAQSVSYDLTSGPLLEGISFTLKKGDRIGLIGHNGCGKSSLLRMIWAAFQSSCEHHSGGQNVQFHPRCHLGYYDQSLQQLNDHDSLLDALRNFTSMSDEQRKMALISAGFPYLRHSQKVKELSGGERSRLLFVGLTLANYHLLLTPLMSWMTQNSNSLSQIREQ